MSEKEHHTVVELTVKINVKSDTPLTVGEVQQLAEWADAELNSNAQYGTDFDFSIGNIAVEAK